MRYDTWGKLRRKQQSRGMDREVRVSKCCFIYPSSAQDAAWKTGSFAGSIMSQNQQKGGLLMIYCISCGHTWQTWRVPAIQGDVSGAEVLVLGECADPVWVSSASVCSERTEDLNALPIVHTREVCSIVMSHVSPGEPWGQFPEVVVEREERRGRKCEIF